MSISWTIIIFIAFLAINLITKLSKNYKIVRKLKNQPEYLEETTIETKDKVRAAFSIVSIKDFFSELVDKYQKFNFNSSLEISTFFRTQHKEFEINKESLLSILSNILDYIRINLESNVISFMITDSKLEYKLDCINLLNIKRDAIQISVIFKHLNLKEDEVNKTLTSPNFMQDSFISNEISKVIEAHFGKINYFLNDSKEFVYIITIPTHFGETKQLKSVKEVSSILSNQYRTAIFEMAEKLIKIGLNNNTISQVTKISLSEVEKIESTYKLEKKA